MLFLALSTEVALALSIEVGSFVHLSRVSCLVVILSVDRLLCTPRLLAALDLLSLEITSLTYSAHMIR